MRESMFNPPSIESIGDLFKSCFFIPVFQRPYSWGIDEIEELFKDISEYYINRKNNAMFIGTVYLCEDGKLNTNTAKYSIIDGQQRITTLVLTLLVLYHYAKKINIDDIHLVELKSLLWKKIGSRYPNKTERVLRPEGLEKEVIEFIFDSFFDNDSDEKLLQNINQLYENNQNSVEKKVVSNLNIIIKNIDRKILVNPNKEKKEELLDFIDFLLNNLQFIAIVVDGKNIKNLFEIFESINSKGKQLDQIDLIKSYLFQNLKDTDYNKYLNIWGNLIKETDDDLENYIYIFIKAFIKFYRVGLSSKYFKTLNIDFMTYYKKENISDALKAFLDDLILKVSNYKKLFDKNSYLLNKDEFKFYSKCMQLLEYVHPNPLLFRTYCEYSNGAISENDLISIVKSSFIFMFSFLTVSASDSKDAISVFEKIMKDIYDNGFNVNKIKEAFNEELIKSSINNEKIKMNIINYLGYSDKGEKIASRIMLIAYEYTNKKGRIKYDVGNYILDNKDIIQIDHILPQTPDPNDDNYTYYKEKINEEDILKLKPNHDFDVVGIQNDISYEMFKNLVLNKIGNLRLIMRSGNVEKSNSVVVIKKYSKFNTYKKISFRAVSLANELVKSEIFNIK